MLMAHHVRRRGFLGLVGGAAAWPLVAHAQQLRLTVGFLVAGTPSSHGQWVTAFVHRLGELGWIEGRTIAIEYRWAEGRTERAAEIAAEFVKRKVDVIVTSGTAVVAVAKMATSTIPIVFAAAGDPVGTGLVKSLAQPGGNVTGLSMQQTDLATKRLELLREVVPGLRLLALLGNVGGPAAVLDTQEVQAAALALGVETIILEIRKGDDIAPVFEALKDRRRYRLMIRPCQWRCRNRFDRVGRVADRADYWISTKVVKSRTAFLVLARALGAAFGLAGHSWGHTMSPRRVPTVFRRKGVATL